MENTRKVRSSSTQENRFLDALNFDYIRIDEQSFEDLILFAVGFSKLIRYYNVENDIEGDWASFFNDEIILLSTIIKSEPNTIEKSFKKNIEKANLFSRPNKRIHYLKRAFEDIYQMATMFENWFRNLKAVERFTDSEIELRTEIFNSISNQLEPALQRLKILDISLEFDIDFKENIGLDYSGFSYIWHLDNVVANPDLIIGDDLKEKTRILTFEIQKIFQLFYENLIYLKNKSRTYLKESLETDTHYPEIALLITFLKLYEHSQENINQLTERYVKFYYDTILRQNKKEAIHDKVYVNMTPIEDIVFADVEEGTEFLAGEFENGEGIIYASNEFLQVNHAKIAKLNSVYLDKQQLNIRGKGAKELIANILSFDIPLEDIDPNTRKQENKSFAPFGENQANKSAYEKTMQNADIGFSIASPGFFLSEGTREVNITFYFTADSFKHLNQYLKDLSISSGDPENEVFVKSFLEAFNIYVTTPEGWYHTEKYVINKNQSESYLKIRFDLENSEPSVVAYDSEIHEGSFDTNLPMVKILLNSESYIYPYSLLKELVLEQIKIDCHVSEIKDLKLYSDIGELSADNPFYPFGSTPKVGSYLIIGKNEIFQKSLDNLSIDIEWFNLPKSKGGFANYYADYRELNPKDPEFDLHNAAFEVELSILDNARWRPISVDERQVLKLYRTEESDKPHEPHRAGILKGETKIENIDISKIKLMPNYKAITEELNYSNISHRGFIRLELVSPNLAYGSTVYPSVLSKVISDNAKKNLFTRVKKGFNVKDKPMPNQPHIPQMRSISLAYSSTAVINFTDRSQKNKTDGGQFFHIYPYGIDLEYPDSSKQITYLVPEFNFEGALLIGFADLAPPQIISMLFSMAEGFSISSDAKLATIEWSYMSNDEWKPLAPSRILQDETNRFIKTGIIKIDVPYDITKNNTILDPNLYWFKISAIQNIESTSKVTTITTQVITATLGEIDEEEKELYLQSPLEADSIEMALQSLPGVQSISQPLESYGGLAGESDKGFYTRVSERLKHKNRAISAWDYERLILANFPNIATATCLPNMGSKNLNAPGNILVVVTPKTQEVTTEPQTTSEVLYNVKNFLQPFTSPFTKLEIRNPSYERIKIICSVKLKDGFNYGFFVQKINEELNRYLIGDMLENKKSLEMGGRINISDILSFMRTLDYVDFITKFSMIQIAKNFQGRFELLDTAKEEDTKSYLQATKPWSVLVPASEHQIFILNSREEIKSEQAGITNLEIGNDFVVD